MHKMFKKQICYQTYEWLYIRIVFMAIFACVWHNVFYYTNNAEQTFTEMLKTAVNY